MSRQVQLSEDSPGDLRLTPEAGRLVDRAIELLENLVKSINDFRLTRVKLPAQV